MKDEIVVDVEDLRCTYGNFEAVQAVSLRVFRGELFALLGTNGAGKTTVMETIEGHRMPDGGRVSVLRADPYRDRVRVRRRTGVMLQESGFAGDLTVLETLRLWARLSSRRSVPRKAIEKVGLGHRANVRVRQLSGGEKRLLDLALATLGDPEVVFLDEPTTGLDPDSRQRTWYIIRDLLARGSTVLLTTHYLEEVEELADRVAIMHEGRMAVSGTIEELLASYPARIGFDLPRGVGRVDLPAIRGVVDPVAFGFSRVEIRTPRLQSDLTKIVAWAAGEGLELRGLRAHDASLDEIFSSVSRGGASRTGQSEFVDPQSGEAAPQSHGPYFANR